MNHNRTDSPELTVAMIRRAVAESVAPRGMPTLSDSDGEFYILWIPERFVQEAFDLGMAPFCPLFGLRCQRAVRYPG